MSAPSTVRDTPQGQQPRVPTTAAWQWVVGLALTFGPDLTGNEWFATGVRATGIALIVFAVAGRTVPPVRTALFVLAVFALPPAAKGEQGATLGLQLLALHVVLTWISDLVRKTDRQSFPVSRSRTFWTLTLMSLPIIYWLIVEVREGGHANTVVLFVAVWIVTWALLMNVRQALENLRLFAASVAVLGAAWLFTVPWMRGGDGGDPVVYVQELGQSWRSAFRFLEWNPLVITNSPGFAGTQRASMVAGEPGTWAMICVLAFVAGAVTLTGRLRTVVLVGVCLGFVGSQSYGALLLLGAVGIVAALLHSVEGRKIPPWAMFGFIVIALGAVPFARYLIESKAELNSRSFTDRGFSAGGLAPSFSVDDRINLISTYTVDGLTFLFLVAALVGFVILNFARLPGIAAGFLLLCAVVLQPIQYHAGTWLLMALLTAAFVPTVAKGRAPTGV